MNFFQRITASVKVLFGRLEAVYKYDIDEANTYITELEGRALTAESKVRELTAKTEADAPVIEKAATDWGQGVEKAGTDLKK